MVQEVIDFQFVWFSSWCQNGSNDFQAFCKSELKLRVLQLVFMFVLYPVALPNSAELNRFFFLFLFLILFCFWFFVVFCVDSDVTSIRASFVTSFLFCMPWFSLSCLVSPARLQYHVQQENYKQISLLCSWASGKTLSFYCHGFFYV
jgi:hypothetical protein